MWRVIVCRTCRLNISGSHGRESRVDIPVLKYVDILIGLALVMALVSTVVLAVTQSLLSSTLARARHLHKGLIRMIAQIDSGSMRPHASYIAALLLRHPLIGRQQTIFTGVRRRFHAWKERRAEARGE